MQTLEKTGIVILDISLEQVANLRQLFQEDWSKISPELSTMEWKTAKIKNSAPTTFLDTAIYHQKKFASWNDHIIIDMGHGRYDFSPINCNTVPPELYEIVQPLLQRNWSAYYGGLPVTCSETSGNGYWHRDFISLFEDESIDLLLPPVYFTAIIPLEDIPIGQGATEFVPGSHRFNFAQAGIDTPEKLNEWLSTQETLHTDLQLGKAYLFNGLTLHRGTKNCSNKCRNAVYMVFKKNWYSDDDPKNYTFSD